MLTKIEMQAMDAVIGIRKELRQANELDWERRRYEIAKEVYPIALNGLNLQDVDKSAAAFAAVEMADLLIAELKSKSDET